VSGSASRSEGVVRTLDGDYSTPGSRHVELVFRSVGERTSELALALAIENVKPQRVHVIEDVKPFALAVRRMLELPHATDPKSPCSHVVHMDADCLILEDMRPFLERERAAVRRLLRERSFPRAHPLRGPRHPHRRDPRMKEVPIPEDDLAYVLRPESRLRNLALAEPQGSRSSSSSFRSSTITSSATPTSSRSTR
jgi:hypothetical protein